MAIVTFVENIFFQNPSEQPIDLGVGPFECKTKEEDQDPYGKKYVLSSSESPIDLGWLEECPGMILIHNRSSSGTAFIKELDILVPPKTTIRFWPTHYKLNLFADEPDTKVYITVLPK